MKLLTNVMLGASIALALCLFIAPVSYAATVNEYAWTCYACGIVSIFGEE